MANRPSEGEVNARADALHARALVIDCHSDLLMPIADGWTRLADDVPVPGTDAVHPPVELPQGSPKKLEWPYGGASCIGQYSLPRFEAGGITTEVCAIFVEDERLDSALKRALEIDADAKPEWRLSNLVMQRRARWLLSRADQLFLE